MAEKSSRTKKLEKMPGNFWQRAATGMSRGLDKMGITQEDDYGTLRADLTKPRPKPQTMPRDLEAESKMERYEEGPFKGMPKDVKPLRKGGKVMKKISEYGGMEKYASKAAMKKHEAKETPMEEKLEKKMGKGMARADMQKVATGAVKKHEKAMHGMAGGGKACGGKMKYAKGGSIDGCATKGKTKGRMV